MKRVKLIVAYDGTNYCGWQIQPNGITIEAVLNKHLSELLQEEIKVTGASRTDSGVHALGNVAVFDTNARMAAEKISFALNTRLPEDIRIQHSCQVPADFHPRFTKSYKLYTYKIYNHTFPNPVNRLYSLFYYVPLDIGRMRRAAEFLIGKHDFKSFCSAGSTVTDTVREIYDITIEESDRMIEIRVKGNGFLYNMIRIIAGTLIQAGIGEFPPEQMKEILLARDRQMAGPTARPHGLTLLEIGYAPETIDLV